MNRFLNFLEDGGWFIIMLLCFTVVMPILIGVGSCAEKYNERNRIERCISQSTRTVEECKEAFK